MAKAGVLYFILALHLLGLYYRFYWTVPNYDVPLHLLGGFWLAMMTNHLVERSGYRDIFRGRRWLRAFLLMGGAAIVGLGWEGFEFLTDTFIFKHPIAQLSSADTMGDLFSDLVGAAFYALF